jgi:hypothetical protein
LLSEYLSFSRWKGYSNIAAHDIRNGIFVGGSLDEITKIPDDCAVTRGRVISPTPEADTRYRETDTRQAVRLNMYRA